MTNAEKIQKIISHLETRLENSSSALIKGGLSSAEWVYRHTQSETLSDVLGEIEKIVCEE